MRLAQACCASLLLHAAMMAVPAGSLAQRTGAGPDGPATAGVRLAIVLQHPASGVGEPVGHARAAGGEAADPGSPAAAVPIGIPASRYYDARELSRRARPIGDIAPLPPHLGGSGSGRLVLVLRIADSGRVDGVDVERAAVDDALAAAVADRFRALRFHPAERHGIAVASRMKIEVLLRPAGA